eukprot:TRINITY_DN51775_c0_g1_i1.p1 TRINITY_DN51775_c0_g1~~TRINITY_DN51775_c0_g1_i1.p1  ORF type:complete len:593 (+),score=176.18 TRINITY_DN51775_c0_g1_i1:102-1781(+)
MAAAISAQQLRVQATRQAQLRGLQMHPDAWKILEVFLRDPSRSEPTARSQGLSGALDTAAELCAGSNQITAAVMQAVVSKMTPAGRGVELPDEDRVQVVALSQVPRLQWDAERNGFTAPRGSPPGLFAPPQVRARAAVERLELIRQRTYRSSNFTHSFQARDAAAMALDKEDEKLPVYGLASLEGKRPTEPLLVIGRLSTNGSGQLYLQDETCRVQLELLAQVREGHYTEGLFHEGSVVIAHGHWENEVFRCDGLGLPSAEPREASFAALPNKVDFFGLAPPPSQARHAAWKLKERKGQLVVLLAHMHADAPGALARLTSLIAGLGEPRECAPEELCVVITGNFSRQPFTYGDTLSAQERQGKELGRYAGLLRQVADAIVAGSAAVAARAQFVFVPGPGDPTPGHGVLPQHPLPEVVMSEVRRRLPHAVMATNPARLRFYGCEMVVYRDDLYRKLRRDCLLPPKQEEYHNSLAKTIADQAHLLPLPGRQAGIAPGYDSLMRLYPLPHLVVIADRDRAWDTHYQGCDFVSPGAFARHGLFAMYHPWNGELEFQQLGAAAP